MRKLLLIIAILAGALTTKAQVSPYPFLKPQFQNNSGQPCSGCLLNTYVAGTTTPQITYADALASVPNANPVVLDATGRAFIFLNSAAYKFVLTTSGGTILWTIDNITASNLSLLASNNVFTGTNTFQATTTFNGQVQMNVGFTSLGPNILGGGGSLSGTFSGNPTFSGSPTFSNGLFTTTGSFSGQITSTVATGTPPFVIASTTNVPNLNASSVNGCTFAIPCPIGSTTPNTGAFTTLSVGTSFTLNGGTPQTGIQGSDTNLLTSGTVAATAGNTLCTDGNHGATTNACSGSGFTQAEGMVITSGICTTAGAETKCTSGPYTWPIAFANSSYALTCSTTNPTGTGGNPGNYGPYITSKSATQFSVVIQSGSNSAAGNNTVTEIDCIGVHP